MGLDGPLEIGEARFEMNCAIYMTTGCPHIVIKMHAMSTSGTLTSAAVACLCIRWVVGVLFQRY
jgi:hypothetical protein